MAERVQIQRGVGKAEIDIFAGQGSIGCDSQDRACPVERSGFGVEQS
jgi:hypothetical protein